MRLAVGAVRRGLREKGQGRGSADMPRGGVRGSRQGKSTVANGNHALPGRSHRDGVTSDEAENAPRLRVTYGEDSKQSKPPLKRRVETHTASAQGNSAPVPWRWRSRGARIGGHIDEWHLVLANAFCHLAFHLGAWLGQPAVVVAPSLFHTRLITVGAVADPRETPNGFSSRASGGHTEVN